MTMLPPEDRPPLAARVDAAMEEASVANVEQALVYAGGFVVIAWVILGVWIPSGIALLVGLLVGSAYFLIATRGRIPARLHPYFLAGFAPLAIGVIWLS